MPEVYSDMSAELRAHDLRDAQREATPTCDKCGSDGPADWWGNSWLCAPCRAAADQALNREVYA